ncbi:uncharacterized protein SCHCODRAFT_02614625 [Schizophyllum commune H4-8]|uniref:ABC1 atypical kinase-like domain-containing protein n=1 Tax=Schizophyllum commune (strain H4-8 / FGSC 9210) TaxID=578458 RepID=D8PZG7_SCHCM|nr:uncharacterized protein SCHCODRAFT_02614625 [Schizophyllum commune H4-8]KAI5896366.1 hypothetical protein SCHCODRAFT_02614625 [Schizophyllum commune H4-8]
MAEEPFAMFAPGRVLALDTNDGRRLNFTVDRLFTPVTKSVVVVARCDQFGPSLVVLKIYDPRFINERNGHESKFGWSKPPRPWSLAAERAAPATFDSKAIYLPEPPADDLAGQFERAAIWEAHLRQVMDESFWYERAAYHNLRDLQGGAIPRLLAEGRFIPPDKRAYVPHSLVLEYIEGVTLGQAPLELLTPAVGVALVRAVESFAAHGVFHHDLNPGNVLVTADGRGVIVDFGCAGVRNSENVWTDEDWAQHMDAVDEGNAIRFMFQRKGVDCSGELKPRWRHFDVRTGSWADVVEGSEAVNTGSVGAS